MLERHAVAYLGGIAAVDLVDAGQGEIFLALARWTHMTKDGVASLQAITLYLVVSHIDIVGRRKVIVIARTKEAITVGHNLEHTVGRDDVGEIVVGLRLSHLLTRRSRSLLLLTI